MEIYLYCSYEHSRTGFFMTRLEGDTLRPATRPGCAPPDEVREFFSYDRYQLLWRDLCRQDPLPKRDPPVDGCFLGLRSLTGTMADGRSGVVNLAMVAQSAGDTAHLRRIALRILSNYDRFAAELFSMLRAGGDCGYELDVKSLRCWLESCQKPMRLRVTAPRGKKALSIISGLNTQVPPKYQPQLLHLAVCTCLWEEIHPTLGDSLLWRIKPRCVLTPKEFEDLFRGGSPLWKLYPSDG